MHTHLDIITKAFSLNEDEIQKNDSESIEKMKKYLNDEKNGLNKSISVDKSIKGSLKSQQERNLKDTEIRLKQTKISNINKLSSELEQSAENTENTETQQNDKNSLGKLKGLSNISSFTSTMQEQAPVNPSLSDDNNYISQIKKFNQDKQQTQQAQPQLQQPQQQPVQNTQQIEQPKRKTVIVKFDGSTKQPFQVEFSERGFLINGTRLSFETIETALSKQYNIALDNGQGIVLDQIKMQKILKYKDRF